MSIRSPTQNDFFCKKRRNVFVQNRRKQKNHKKVLTNPSFRGIITRSTNRHNGGIAQWLEHPVHTRQVIGSNPISATRPVGQAVKTRPFHGCNMGSIPVRVTNPRKNHLKRGGFFFSWIGDPYDLDQTQHRVQSTSVHGCVRQSAERRPLVRRRQACLPRFSRRDKSAPYGVTCTALP